MREDCSASPHPPDMTKGLPLSPNCHSQKTGLQFQSYRAHCNTLQHPSCHTATRCNTQTVILKRQVYSFSHVELSSESATHCNTLQHTATRCNTLQHAATHSCRAVFCESSENDFLLSSQDSSMHCNTPQHAATHCNTLQHTATHCNTLQLLSVITRQLNALHTYNCKYAVHERVLQCVAVCCSVLQCVAVC